MNENEKMPLNDEQTSPRREEPVTSDASACAVNESPAMDMAEAADNAEQTKEADAAVCAETESPAMDLAEAADNAAETKEADAETCAETESPAMDLAEAADAAEAEKKGNEYHGLSKEELVGKLKEILENNDMQAHKDVTLIRQAFFNIRRRETEAEMQAFLDKGNEPGAFAAAPDPIEEEMKTLVADFKEKRNAYLAAEEERKQENLAKKLRAIDAIKALMEDVDNINRNYPEFQRLQTEFKEAGDIPQPSEAEVWKQYQAVVEEFYDLLKMNKELRDLDFKKNLEAKRKLIEEAKALAELDDPIAAVRRLQELHNEWREIGPVAKDLRVEIWDEFKEASSVVNKRHQAYFDQRKEEEKKNEEGKTALCEEIEALDFSDLKTFADWDKMTQQIQELQNRWKTFGYASKKSNNALYSRFRKTIDDFFSKKSDFFKKVKEEYKQNLEKKEALVAKAEALAADESADVSEAVRQIRQLQDEWKTIGSVDRKVSDTVWQKFQKACRTIFDRHREANAGRRAEEKAALAEKKEILEALQAIYDETEETGDSIRRTRALQDKWRNAGRVPYEKKDEINGAYREIIAKLTAKLGLGERRERREGGRPAGGNRQGGARMSRINANLSPREQLQQRIKAKKTDLQTYENNMGFFNVKTSAGSSMLKELQNKIDMIKIEIAELEKQLDATAE